MSEPLGAVRIDFLANLAEFTRSIDFADKRNKKFGADAAKTFDALGKSARRLGTEMSLFVTAPIVGLAAAAVKAADPTGQLGKRLKTLGEEAQLALKPLGEELIKAFDRLEPMLREVVGAVAGLAEGFSMLPEPVKLATLGLTGALAVIGPLALGVASLSAALKGLSVSFLALQSSGALQLLGRAGAAGLVGAGTGWGLDALLSQPTYYAADGTPMGSGWQVLLNRPIGPSRPNLAGLGDSVATTGAAALQAGSYTALQQQARELRLSVRPLEVLARRMSELDDLISALEGTGEDRRVDFRRVSLPDDVIEDLRKTWTLELDPGAKDRKEAEARAKAISFEAFPERRIESERREIALLLQGGFIDAETAQQRLKQLDNELLNLNKSLKETFGDKMQKQIAGFATSAADSFTNFVFEGTAALDDLVEAWGRALTQMAVQTLIFQPLFDSLGKGIGGLFGGTDGGSSTPPVTDKKAHGGVYGPRGPIPFARGGVVRRPTLFPFARGIGLMGEAGPEAILPLTRVGKDLGVKASGGGVTINIIDQRSSGAPVETRETTSADGRRVIEVTVRDAVRRLIGSGQLDRLMGQTYGVRRRGNS